MNIFLIVFLIVLGLLLFLFTWLIIAPIGLVINTEKEKYTVYVRGLLSVRMQLQASSIILHFRIFFIPLKFDLLKMAVNKSQKKSKKKRKPKKRRKKIKNKKSLDMWFIYSIAKKILNSFKLKSFRINIDTGNNPLNAQLYPIAAYFSNEKAKILVNFNEENKADIHISNQIIKIAYIFIKYIIIHKLKQIKAKKNGKHS
jgi:hypothetical protein